MSYINYVNIKHGTASVPRFSNGNTLPLVQMPFGMNGYALQTESNRGNWYYHPKDRSLEGIRITHQPSPWIGDHSALIMMPQRSKPFGNPDRRWSGYRPEEAKVFPHYMNVDLLRYRVTFELAPTTRGGIIKLNFEGDEDTSFAVIGDKGTSKFHVDLEQNSVTGFVQNTSWDCADGFGMYFVAKFDCPIVAEKTFTMQKDGAVNVGTDVAGEACGVSVGLTEKEVIVRFATSFISFEQAERTLEQEVQGKSYDEVKELAKNTWEHYLSKIEIETEDEELKKLFYSCMYRLFLYPSKFYEIDENGNNIHYCADTGKVCKGVKYVNHGFWDTFRTVFPLYSLIAKNEFAEILEGFVNTYKSCGWLPKWPAPNEVGMMPGTLIDAVIAEAAVKGIGSEELLRTAFEGVMKHATQKSDKKQYGRQGIEEYNKYGYLPNDMYHESLSNTLDYVYGDYCISQIAAVLGEEEIQKERLESSKNYKKLFDEKTGFMRARNQKGEFAENFDQFAWGGEYCEGGPWQAGFAVYHDIEGFAELYGGKEKLMEKIDTLFATKPYYAIGGYRDEIHEMTEMAAVDFGQCAISNQPSFHIPYIYAALGEKEKTEYWVSHLLKNAFTAEDDGFPGDEDNGTTSAWVIFSTLGLYPFCPGKPEYLKIAPQVKKAVIHTENRDYVITNEPCTETVISYNQIVGEKDIR